MPHAGSACVYGAVETCQSVLFTHLFCFKSCYEIVSVPNCVLPYSNPDIINILDTVQTDEAVRNNVKQVSVVHKVPSRAFPDIAVLRIASDAPEKDSSRRTPRAHISFPGLVHVHCTLLLCSSLSIYVVKQYAHLIVMLLYDCNPRPTHRPAVLQCSSYDVPGCVCVCKTIVDQ